MRSAPVLLCVAAALLMLASGAMAQLYTSGAPRAAQDPSLIPAQVQPASTYPNIFDLGCWADLPSRTLPICTHIPTSASADRLSWCLAAAVSNSHLYAGLQNGNECCTGNNYQWMSDPQGFNGSVPEGCGGTCPGQQYSCGGYYANRVYQKIIPAPPATCSLSNVLAVLPSNTVRGNCSDVLAAGASCAVSCVSSFQVLSGPNYACSSAGGLSGGQVCVDAVCTQPGPGSEVIVQVAGAQYTGPSSASLGSYISASASVPYPGIPDTGEVVGSLVFEGPGSVICAASSAVSNTASVGQCAFAVPPSGSSFTLTTSFVYQKDWCIKYVATVSSNITLVDLARLQSLVTATKSGLDTEVSRANQADNAQVAATAAEAAARSAGDASLRLALSNETARAIRVEGDLRSDASLLAARVGVLEVAQPSFLFQGLQVGIDVAYPAGAQPGSGVASLLNKRIIFDAPLSSRGAAVRYNITTGVVSIVQAGSYRLDAFVHLYAQQGNSVGTGVVSWMTVGSSPQPIGANILNPNAAGVPQGTVGDNTFVSTLINVPEGTSAAAPFTAQCVLVSMNQRKNQITDASVISVTKLK